MKKLSVALFSLGLLLMFQGSVTINAQSTPNYVLATDEDFSGTSNGNFRYIGTDEYVEIPHVIKGVPVTSYYRMFEGASVKGVKSTNTNVTDMSYMFYNSQATELDLSNFDTSNVTDMSWMFYNASSLTELDLSNFDTSNVTHMYGMFYSASSLTELDLSSFDTSKVTNMGGMFAGTSGLTELDLSNFDTSSVTNMGSMFYGASSLTELDLSNFNTSNVTDMSGMFYNASSLTELDLSSFDTSNVRDMTYMFRNVNATKGYARTQADADRFNASSGKPSGLTFVVKSHDKYVLATDSDFSGTSNGSFRYIGTDEYVEIPHVIKGVPVTSYRNMFARTSVKGVKSTNTNVTDISYMFWSSQATELDLSSFDTSSVTYMYGMFAGASSLTELDVSGFDTSNVTDMGSMFEGVSSLTELNLSNFDTSNVTDMSWMFSYANSLTKLDLSNFDTSKVTDMSLMFEGASSLTELNLSNFDTSNVTDMHFMFADASGLTELDLSSFDTSKVTDMSGMFAGASSLTGLDLSSFDTSNVTDMRFMFDGASSLTKLDLRGFETSRLSPRFLFGLFFGTNIELVYAKSILDAERLAHPDTFDGEGSIKIIPVHYPNISIEEKPDSYVKTIEVKPLIVQRVLKGKSNNYEDDDGGGIIMMSLPSFSLLAKGDEYVESDDADITSYQYVVTKNPTPDSSGWQNVDNSGTIIVEGMTGDYYLHVRVENEQGETASATSGVLKLDNTPPTINVTPNKTEQTHENITLTVTATDSHSGIKRIKLPNGEWINDTTATYVAKSNGEYEFIAEDNAGNTTTETILVNNIVGTISMEQPVISSFSEINLKNTTEIVSANIEPVIISDWRDGTNEWKLSVSASRLQLTDDSFILPKGSIRIAGLDKIDKVEGDGILPTKSFSSIMPIDDEQVEIAKGAQSKGKFELIFPNNALEIVIDPYVTKKGTYYSTITWELVNAP